MELLTEDELLALDLTAKLSNVIYDIVGFECTRNSDLGEIFNHIHSIQYAITSQAAGRAYPNNFRLLGGLNKDGNA